MDGTAQQLAAKRLFNMFGVSRIEFLISRKPLVGPFGGFLLTPPAFNSPNIRSRRWADAAMSRREPRQTGGTMILYNQIKRNLEHVCDFFQSCCCAPSPSAFQVGNVALSDVRLVRDVELRFTAPFAKRSQRIL